MVEMKLLRKVALTNTSIEFSIAPEGWERISDLQKISTESNQAFVAMWFDEQMDPIYDDGIKPAVEAANYECMKINEKPHNDKVCDQIIAEIRKSRFIIADFTGNRGGVYFEAGFAMGLGLPVIWLARKDYEKKLHFDTRQYNHIFYEDAKDLELQLRRRIEATIF